VTKFPEDDGLAWRSENFRRIGERGNVLLGQSRCRKCYEGRKESEREETNRLDWVGPSRSWVELKFSR
jgi:hypothetical protein